MIIDTEFNTGENVCYLNGDNISHSSISNIVIETSHSDQSFTMIYKLSDGTIISRDNYPKWNKRIFKDKKSIIKYLEENP